MDDNYSLFDPASDAVHQATNSGSSNEDRREHTAAATASDPDELEMPGGLRDDDNYLPDNWPSPRAVPDELDDVMPEVEYVPAPDKAAATEPPPTGAAPATPLADVRRISVAVQSTELWPNMLGDAARVPSHVVEARAAEIRAMGQLRACRGRWSDNGHVQIVAGLLDWLAVRLIAEQGGEPWTVLTEASTMTDEEAFKVAYAEAAEGVPLAPIDHARFVRRAIDRAFGTQRGMAEKLGLHESNISRLLDVHRCAEIVGKVVTDEWSISRAQAGRFMRLHEDKSVRKPLLMFLQKAEAEPQTARRLFAAVFARFEPPPPPRKGEVVVTDEQGDALGRVRRKGGGEVVLVLDKAAGAVELPTLVGFVEAALARIRAGIA